MFSTEYSTIDTELLEAQIRAEAALLEQRRRALNATAPAPVAAVDDPPAEPAAPAPAPPPVPMANAPMPVGRRIKEIVRRIPGLAWIASALWAQRQFLIPLLLEIKSLRRAPPKVDYAVQYHGAYNILFVGSWDGHKGQVELVRMMEALRLICDEPLRLILVGEIFSRSYFDAVMAEVRSQHLQDVVVVIERADASEMRALYKAANLYVSMSLHEIYSLPLVEAMRHDVPVIAYENDLIRETLGSAGLIVNTRERSAIAPLAKLILQDLALYRAIIRIQRRQVERFEHPSAVAEFVQSVSSALTGWRPRPVVEDIGSWRIEGPFDSSYSLAVVNREVAVALAEQGGRVALQSREGGGPFAPSMTFCRRNPKIAALWRNDATVTHPDVVVRNTYPPRVSDIKGDWRGLVCYAWEESGFPQDYVREFNHYLDFVAVTSRFVAKVMRDNGVTVPVRVVGDGIDQIARLAGRNGVNVVAEKHALGEGFCFLHISSCFPRKGVDVLLAAWAKSFRDDDDVVLVIKTSPNPHNTVEHDIAGLRQRDPHCARIVLINGDLEPADIAELYRRADVVVCPSRGEGFGLPLAEAFAMGRPVIATGFGGQMDFCSNESAWLCDYDFAYADTHISTAGSVWVEPRVDSLTDCLRAARNASPQERARRAEIGRDYVNAHFGWRHVAERLRQTVAEVQGMDAAPPRPPRIGVISTWNSRCGIAGYSEKLTSGIDRARLVVFANYNAQLIGRDSDFIRRSWEQGWRDSLDQVFGSIEEEGVDAVLIQFNYGFYQLQALGRLIERLVAASKHVYLFMHSTTDIDRPELVIRLSDVVESLRLARRVFVHSVPDLNRMKRIGLVENVTLLPHGFPEPPIRKQKDANSTARKTIGSFGYLLRHKGLLELIEAVALMRDAGTVVNVLMLHALYPGEESAQVKAECEAAIQEFGLADQVILRTDYLGESEIIAQLAETDLVAFPYQQTQESSSAAARFGVASLTPVATTPLAIFDDLKGLTHRLPGCGAADLAKGLMQLLADSSELYRFSRRQQGWVNDHRWPVIWARLESLIRSELALDVAFVPQVLK